jgi:hypothetical protein
MYNTSADISYWLRKARYVEATPSGRGTLSTGELLAVAIILNKAAWIKEAGYTIAEAIDRFDPNELGDILRTARQLRG